MVVDFQMHVGKIASLGAVYFTSFSMLKIIALMIISEPAIVILLVQGPLYVQNRGNS